MAAAKLDALWDSSMVALSESYVKTIDLLAENKTSEASAEFKEHFVAPMKKLYSEAAEVYPLRFQKTDDWCKWTKRLYVLTRTMEDALKDGERGDAEECVPLFRVSFYVLHEKAQVLKSNDYIFAFRKELQGDAPSVEALAKFKTSLDSCEPSMKAKAEKEAYEQAKRAWLERVSPTLSTGALTASQISELRTATESFYRDFGIQFE